MTSPDQVILGNGFFEGFPESHLDVFGGFPEQVSLNPMLTQDNLFRESNEKTIVQDDLFREPNEKT